MWGKDLEGYWQGPTGRVLQGHMGLGAFCTVEGETHAVCIPWYSMRLFGKGLQEGSYRVMWALVRSAP